MRHYALAHDIRRTLTQYADLKDIIAMLGLEQLSPEETISLNCLSASSLLISLREAGPLEFDALFGAGGTVTEPTKCSNLCSSAPGNSPIMNSEGNE